VKAGLPWEVIMNSTVNEVQEWLEVERSIEKQDELVAYNAGRMSVADNKSFKRITDKLSAEAQISLGNNPLAPSKSDIEQSKEQRKQGLRF
jgi:hypothetical protein